MDLSAFYQTAEVYWDFSLASQLYQLWRSFTSSSSESFLIWSKSLREARELSHFEAFKFAVQREVVFVE
jgi:hypothetical protein